MAVPTGWQAAAAAPRSCAGDGKQHPDVRMNAAPCHLCCKWRRSAPPACIPSSGSVLPMCMQHKARPGT